MSSAAAGTPPTLPVGGLTGPNSPFAAMSKGISKSQSIAFTVVFALFSVILFIRLRRGVVHKVVYVCLAIFGLFRIVTFALRAVLSTRHAGQGNFIALLMASGIFVVGGFLLLVEAVFFLSLDWHYALKGKDRDPRRKRLMLICHACVVVLTLIGIVGAVLMLTSLQQKIPNMKTFDASKKLRIASGAMFLIFCVGLTVLPILISMQTPHHASIRRTPITLLLVLFGVCLILECVYRVWSAVVTKGFIQTQSGIDVFLVLPEWLIMLPAAIINFEEMGNIRLWRGERCGPATASDEETIRATSSKRALDEDKDGAVNGS